MVEAYVQVTGNGSDAVYDISKDIVQASVTRTSNASSTFNITLQNKGWKYNGVFTPMDKIVIYATKSDRVKLLTGYITTVDKFTLYQSDFKMSGECVLHQLMELYWDPQLKASIREFFWHRSVEEGWGGFEQTVVDLLTKVGGWDKSRIAIGDIPDEAIMWARELYAMKADDVAQAKQMADDFYDILRNHGPSVSTSSKSRSVNLKGSDAQKAVCELYLSWEGMFEYSQAGGRLDPVNTGYGDCSSTIWRAYQDATGVDCGTWTGDMVNKGELIDEGRGRELPIDIMEPADLIIVNHSYHNDSYDHVELYLGDDRYMGHGGPGNGPTVKSGAAVYGLYEYDWQVRRYL